MALKWVMNAYDPRLLGAERQYCNSSMARTDALRQQEWQRWMETIKDCTIGQPKESNGLTVAELKALHMVGLYREVKE